MFNFFKRIKLFPKLLIGILFVVCIPLAEVWYINNIKFHDHLEKKLRDDLSHSANLLSEQIDAWSDINFRLLDHISSLDDISSMETELQLPILKSIITSYEWTYLAYSVGKDGFKTARSDAKPIYKEDGSKAFYRGDRTYFSDVMNGKSYGQQVLLSRTLGKPAFILCAPIDRQSEALGTLCIGMTLEDMSVLVSQLSLGKTGYAVLLDGKNKVIAHGRPDTIQESLQDLSSHPLVNVASSKYVEYELGGTRKVGYRIETAVGWSLIVEQDYSEAFAPLQRSKNQALILLVVTILVSFVVAYFISLRIVQPIKHLTEVAEGISKGKFISAKLEEDKRGDEIGSLARAIERMSISIRIAFQKLKEDRKQS